MYTTNDINDEFVLIISSVELSNKPKCRGIGASEIGVYVEFFSFIRKF